MLPYWVLSADAESGLCQFYSYIDSRIINMMSSSLASLKACIPEFKPAELSDSGKNQDRSWKE